MSKKSVAQPVTPGHPRRSKKCGRKRKNSCADSTRPRGSREDRSHKGARGRISRDLRRRRPVALQKREKGILGRGIMISFEEQQLIALDHPSAHDRFGINHGAAGEKRER